MLIIEYETLKCNSCQNVTPLPGSAGTYAVLAGMYIGFPVGSEFGRMLSLMENLIYALDEISSSGNDNKVIA